ncbi:hypothetical protein [Nocardia sp. NPDC049149]|uniref:hypothetical protein n=1 Tax=Nocardia sp. NPDC049149 TaxID=3364315 RepID=UPI0037129D9B
MEYTVTINFPGDGGDYSVGIDLYDEGFAGLQIGDTVMFDLDGGGLTLVVRGRQYWVSSEGPPRLYVDTVLRHADGRVLERLKSGDLIERLRRCSSVRNVRMD